MKTFIGINNVEHFADQLSSEVDRTKRAILMRLLVEEEDKLGTGLQQLGVAELRIATGHRLIAKQKALIAHMECNGRDSREARDLLGTLVEVQTLFERYRHTIMRVMDQHII